MCNKCSQKLETRSADASTVVWSEKIPEHLFSFLALSLFSVLRRVELKDVNHFTVVHFLVSDTPRTYELETIGKGLEHAWGDSVKVCLWYLFIVTHFFWLLKLFISKVQKHFKSKLEYFRLLFERESVLEVSFRESRNLWIRVEESAVPKGENFLNVWTKLSLSFDDKHCKTFMSSFSNQFILFV